MARTKGAKDQHPRRKPAGSTIRSQSQAGPGPKVAIPQRPEAPGLLQGAQAKEEFRQAIAADLGRSGKTEQGPGPKPGQAPEGEIRPAVDVLVGVEGWQAMLETPFRMLSIWFAVPRIEEIGHKRGPDLAKPSYPIYCHYIEQWLKANPDDPLVVAKVTTLAVLSGVAFEVWIALQEELAKRQKLRAGGNIGQEQGPPPPSGRLPAVSPIA